VIENFKTIWTECRDKPGDHGFSHETLNVFDSSERTPLCYALAVDETHRKDILLELMGRGKQRL